MSKVDVWCKYPMADSARVSMEAKPSQKELWTCILLMNLHWNVWSSNGTCVLPHQHHGGGGIRKYGQAEFALDACVKDPWWEAVGGLAAA